VIQDRREFLKAVAGVCCTPALGTRAGAAVAQTGTAELTGLSLLDASGLIRARKVSPVELTKACLARIERLNPVLNAFITVTADTALKQARDAESDIQQGNWRGPLHGMPVALKDIIDAAGVRTTAASALFKDRVAEQDSEVVRRLNAAGAVLLGKLNLHEFAYGGTSITSHFGAVHNPWKTDHIAGGSSGGSGAAVAAGLCFGALGTDTGGSIRLPATHCGIVGLKPTYGRVSTRGVVPLSWSLDHVGPMTRTVADAAAMLQVLAGYDSQEPSSVNRPVPEYGGALEQKADAFRLGLPREYFEALHPEVESAVNAALAELRKLTAGIQDVPFPVKSDDRTTIRAAEAYAYHAAFVAATPALYQPEVLARIRVGADVSARAYIEARRRMEQARRTAHEVFTRVDCLVMPTVAMPPTTIAETPADDVPRIRNVAPINFYGYPAISLPCGFTRNGLPIGLQIVAPSWGEQSLLTLAKAYERVTEWHTRRPSR
jgi:aspartyl-tRNA(Asn)/glutamyl-tRNA(Gln) amidotransferase subunit A